MTARAGRPVLALVDPSGRRRARLVALSKALGLEEGALAAMAAAPVTPEPQVRLVVGVGLPGSESLAAIRAAFPGAILIAAAHDRGQASAVAALRAGADDFVCLSDGDGDLVGRARHHLDDLHCPAAPDPAAEAVARDCGLVGDSPAMRELRAFLVRVAASEATALITGETGAGKECAALTLHRAGRRAKGPLVALNCAAIPDDLLEGELFGYVRGAFSGAVRDYPGKLRLAHGGTLFLDEVGELSASAQAKLLRALEAREAYPLGARAPQPFDARVVAASNRDLGEAVAKGRFREDLYYRLAVARIRVPPLRERDGDVPALARLLLSRLGAGAPRLSDDAGALLAGHDWPGNARELRNTLEVAGLTCAGGVIRPADLPPGLRPASLPCAAEGGGEKALLTEILRRTGGNKAAAARALNCSRMTLYRRMARNGMAEAEDAPGVPPPPAAPSALRT